MFGFLPINLLPTGGPRFREISSLLQWVYCFNLYVGVCTSDPVARDIMTYSRLLMHEAMRHGGCGWLHTIGHSVASCPLTHLFNGTHFYLPCMPQPSLGIVQAPDLSVRSVTNVITQQKAVPCFICSSQLPHLRLPSLLRWGQLHPPLHIPDHRQYQRRPDTSVLNFWNSGSCSYPGRCIYRHLCSTCQLCHNYG